jgi:ribosomal protein S18 acetylase RimI-like enzyme
MDLRDEAIHQAFSPQDIERARELFREYADWLKVDLCFQGFEGELATLPGGYAPPDGRLLIAYHHEKPVGCIALRRLDASTGEIKRLYVRSEARGRRTGRRLVEQLIAAAREIGYRRLVLDTLPQMTQALALYHWFGFRETPGYYANPLPGVAYLALDLAPAA